MRMTIALTSMPAQTAFAKFKDAASAALKQFVDGAGDDDAFWGAVTKDLTNPLVSPLIGSTTAYGTDKDRWSICAKGRWLTLRSYPSKAVRIPTW